MRQRQVRRERVARYARRRRVPDRAAARTASSRSLIAPRAISFFATGGALDSANVPAFDDVFEPVDISAGRKLPTPASDVFTLAASLGTLIAGRHPYATGSWARQIDAMTRVDGGWRDIDDAVLRVLETALVRDPAARPTAQLLRDRLAAVR